MKNQACHHTTHSEINDQLQILEYIATNTREGLTPGDRQLLKELLAAKGGAA
jgi:hypothetical protein